MFLDILLNINAFFDIVGTTKYEVQNHEKSGFSDGV